MKMKFLTTLMIAYVGLFSSVSAQKTVVDIAVGSNSHSKLVFALKTAGLDETLKGAGPFTVFAPTNAAFSKLPLGTVDNLLKPENKSALVKILTNHVVAGNLDLAAIIQAIKAGNGKAVLKTLSGGSLTATYDGLIRITDEKGGVATINRDKADLKAGNGFVHVIDNVAMPK